MFYLCSLPLSIGQKLPDGACRACEQPCSIRTATPRDGSTPRVRGTGALGARGGRRWRFSPACAGNRARLSATRSRSAVQPRVCGEQRSPASTASWRAGSAPRVRGTARGRRLDPTRRRFSPACAGNSHRGFRISFPVPVQPRVCGEQSPWLGRVRSCRGSAPRVRGTGRTVMFEGESGRFSPACAGNRSRHARQRAGDAVQPRVCGEQLRPGRMGKCPYGSAPRVRGTERDHSRDDEFGRFSPACAGNRAFNVPA